MQVPQFIVLAHNCWCQSCFMSAHQELGYKAGVVTGHLAHRRGWQCVYCGGQVYRHTHMAVALWQSLSSWVGWCLWELKMARYFRISAREG